MRESSNHRALGRTLVTSARPRRCPGGKEFRRRSQTSAEAGSSAHRELTHVHLGWIVQHTESSQAGDSTSHPPDPLMRPEGEALVSYTGTSELLSPVELGCGQQTAQPTRWALSPALIPLLLRTDPIWGDSWSQPTCQMQPRAHTPSTANS